MRTASRFTPRSRRDFDSRDRTIVLSDPSAATVFDFGEFSSEMATRKSPAGTTSFLYTTGRTGS
jgi:hypothetical protein